MMAPRITKRKATLAAKKSSRARSSITISTARTARAARSQGTSSASNNTRGRRQNDRNSIGSEGEADQEEDQDDNPEPIEIDEDEDDPLYGVTDPIQRITIKNMLKEEERKDAEEKRKEELHQLEIRQREQQINGTAGAPTATSLEDDFGESSLSSSDRSHVLLFPMVPKKHVIAIARNTFDPSNLPFLENLILDDTTSDVSLTVENGRLKQSKTVGKNSNFGHDDKIWSTNFLTYTAIVSVFHGPTHPLIISKLIAFHNLIIELAKTYEWQKAVLVLALLHHKAALHKGGFADLDAWELPTNLIDRYCRQHLRSRNPSATTSKPSQSAMSSYENNPTNKAGVICMNYNRKTCSSDRCHRDHKCETCGGAHPAKGCKRTAQTENKTKA